MGTFSPREVASMFMNVVALLLLLSLYFTTDIYRERGRYDDKLFFVLIIIDTVMAVSDGVSYVADARHLFSGIDKWMLFFNTCLLYGMTLFGAVFFALFHYRLFRDEERTRRLLRILLVIEALLLVMNVLNARYGFFFSVDAENDFIYGSFSNVQPLIAEFWIAIPCIYAIIVRKRMPTARYIPAVSVLLLDLVDAVVACTIDDVTIYAITRAIMLCYLHMAILNEEFYAKGGAAR